MEAKADVNRANKTGWTPLCIAAQEGHASIVQLLTKANVDVNTTNQDGATPLYVAARRAHESVIRILIKSEQTSTWLIILGGHHYISLRGMAARPSYKF